MDARTVLVVEHEANTPSGWVGDSILEAGCVLEVKRPHAGDTLPVSLDGYDGVLVLGGSMDAWDDEGTPWLPGTRDLVRSAERRGVPTLGICLGHQLAVLALGGEVDRNPAGGTIAVVPVGWGDAARDDPLLGPVRRAAPAPTYALHWNRDVALRLPPGAQVLACSPDGAVQAARLGRSVWGVQCHPEVGLAILTDWAGTDGPDGADALIEDVRRREQELWLTWRPLGAAFASLLGGAA